MTGSIKDYTPNYSFIIPEFNITGWHDYLEANFRSIDALLYNIFVVNGYKGEWTNSTLYEVGSVVFIGEGNGELTGKLFKALIEHTTPNDGNFETFYENNPDNYEQFADFDAAERAAELAKAWATKMNGTVDGIEYSAKHYAQEAQQIINNVVHLTGNETISGTKTFTNNLVKKDNAVTKGTNPLSTQYWSLQFTDKNGESDANRLGLLETKLATNGDVSTYLGAYKNTSDSTTQAQIKIVCTQDGTMYATAPTPTDTTSTSSKQIATVGWVNSTGNNVVHKTGTETIAGNKTLTGTTSINTANITTGTATTLTVSTTLNIPGGKIWIA